MLTKIVFFLIASICFPVISIDDAAIVFCWHFIPRMLIERMRETITPPSQDLTSPLAMKGSLDSGTQQKQMHLIFQSSCLVCNRHTTPLFLTGWMLWTG